MLGEEFLRGIEDIQRVLTPDEGQADPLASPGRAEGADTSGTVRVALGPDGLPESLRLQSGWRRAVGSEEFGAAVTAACTAAANSQLAARFESRHEERPPAEPAAERPTRSPVDTSRDLFDVVKDLVDLMDNIDAVTRPVAGSGTTAFGKLVVTVSETGLESCVADPRWVSTQSDNELEEAFGKAFASARADLAEARTARGVPVDRLAGEILGMQGRFLREDGQ